MGPKKVIVIEQDFEKIKIYVTGKDNFLHTRVIETDVYELAELLLVNELYSKKHIAGNKVSIYEWIPIIGLFTGLYKRAEFNSGLAMLLCYLYQFSCIIYLIKIIIDKQ